MLHTLLLKCQPNSDEQKEAKEKKNQTNSPAISSMPPVWCGIDLRAVCGGLAHGKATTYIRMSCDSFCWGEGGGGRKKKVRAIQRQPRF